MATTRRSVAKSMDLRSEELRTKREEISNRLSELQMSLESTRKNLFSLTSVDTKPLGL